MSNAGHLNDDILERYAMSRLSEAESETIEDHIAFCPHCLDRLDQTTAFVEGMRTSLRNSGKEQVESKVKKPNWLQRWGTAPAWAGAALAAAGIFLAVNHTGNLPAPALVTLDGTRGAATVVHGTGPFDFELFMPAAGAHYHVELLDSDGGKCWESDVPGAKGTLHAVVKRRLAAGQYFLHVTEPVSGSQHDYAVQVVK
jgi:hypothetical protein